VAERFSIAQVTPHPWESRHEVNTFVDRVSAELLGRGHRVLILAPSESHDLVRRSRQALRRARDRPGSLLEGAGLSRTDGGVPVFAVGEVLPFPAAVTRRGSALPIDVARTIEELLGTLVPDFVHVHEPFAPSTASAALRHSRSLNVGTFHAPAERLVTTQVARRVVELFFGRLDARTASFAATRDLMARYFPGEYRVVSPGADGQAAPRPGAGADDRPVRLAFIEEEERAALRLFLRGLRHLDLALPWEVTVLSARGASSSIPLRAEVRERVHFEIPGPRRETDLLAQADVLVCASDGTMPVPGLILRALAAGAIPLASHLPVYAEALAEGQAGLLFEVRETDTLTGQLTRLVADAQLRARLRSGAAPLLPGLAWSRVAGELEEVYASVASRRRPARVDAALARRLRARSLIDVDLHMHTDHSHDCATPVDVLLATAREQGLGAIAVTDHNVISGAFEARAKADGLKVIVAEEIKTAGQGEVIGLFLERHIDRGMTLGETVAEIRRQGGLVYVPHPFDRLHAVPDYEHLLEILGEIDALEVFNPRVAIGSFNDEAARFAAKYRIPAGAGSDAHVPQGLGSVRVRMRDFDSPEEFLASLPEAEIVTRPTSLLYVQALKFLQTRATPSAARSRRQRRARRAIRRP
jgi:hypothetical protein